MTASPLANNPHVVGHAEAIRQVTGAFASGRMHHAWLMTGADGIGKATLAYHIADHVLSSGQNPLGRVDLQHRITKLIMAEAHPDMLVIRRVMDEKTGDLRNVIVVDDALKVATFLRKTSTHGGWRVVIIDEAHRLNRHGQNAILKILEEPPSQALILMTATTPGALLPTIRSRSRVLNLAPLDEAQMRSILTRTAPELPFDDINRLIKISGGSIGFALKVIATETLPLFDEMIALIGAPKLEISRMHALSDRISRKADAESFDVLTTLLMNFLRTDIVADAQKPAVQHPALAEKLQLWDKIQSMFSTAEHGNLDRKLTFINVMGEIANAG
jgi:DNA polymerase-3 subunit delta'